MRKLAFLFVVAGVLFVVQAGAVAAQCHPGTTDFQAGPIWDNNDAKRKCPETCSSNGGTWNGQWRTTVWGKMSVCGCHTCCRDVEAGPIWNQQDAEKKCPEVCSNARGSVWNGQWVTTVPGEMSVCGCCGNCCKMVTKDEQAGPIWDQADAEKKCPTVCAKANGTWNGQWTTTDPGKMSVCGCMECSG